MVALGQLEIPFFKGIGRQRGRCFGALAQVIGKTAIPCLPKNFVPAAKRVGAELLDFSVPEIAEDVTGRKDFKTAAKKVGRQTLRKQLGVGSRKRSASRWTNPIKTAKQTTRLRRDFLKPILTNRVN